jgi:hypothetical protein
MKIVIEPDLPTDSDDYNVISEGVAAVANVSGMTCEIGLRLGGGTKTIIDTLIETKQNKVHIAIDPYGNIDYIETDDSTRKLNYTNQMRNQCLVNMYMYCLTLEAPFLFFNLEDTEFFKRFSDGVPIYNEYKTIETQYSFIHLDGPHNVESLLIEIDFFHNRTPVGAIMVFDDVANYDHGEVHDYLASLGWISLKTSPRKWSYIKTEKA